MKCMWCELTEMKETTKDCYWIMPDGKASIHILQIPAVSCANCGLYLTDEMNHEIDMALYAREIDILKKEISYKELMSAPYKALKY